MKEFKMTGKVIQNFNDGKDNMKPYEVGDIYTADRFRYEELQSKGYVEVGKEVKDYFQTKKDDRKDEEE